MFRWVPALYPSHPKPEQNPAYRAAVAAGRQVLDDPQKQFDDIDMIQTALAVKYGPDVYSKFFHACLAAAAKGELDFTPGRHIKRDEIVKYMSQAAGEDVGPIYRQWSGFAGAE
jgi:hypothetical protein